MPQEDYFKREIDKLGKVLAKVLGDLLNLKSANVSDGIEAVNHVFKNELDITVNSLLDLPDEELLPFLIQRKKLTNSQIELIADILARLAEDPSSGTAQNIYRKALLIYNRVTENEKNYSVGRHEKIQELKNLIKKSDN